jgi:hypothetical protein
MKNKAYENYPSCIVFASNLVSIGIYLLGGYIIYQMGLIWLLIYLAYIVWLEIKLLKDHCVSCYYYGKNCAFGRGKLSCLFFKKDAKKKFINIKLTWKDILPDFLVSIIPLLVGVVLLIRNFSWLLLGTIVLLFLLMSAGNGFIRGTLACKYCKQRELGCPAEKLFSKKK